jgi:hypothetical protein
MKIKQIKHEFLTHKKRKKSEQSLKERNLKAEDKGRKKKVKISLGANVRKQR